MVVHAENAAVPDGAQRFAAALRAPREVAWVEARSQFDFYDDPKTIERALGRVVPFLERTLATRAGVDRPASLH
jgi:hypothetical protein